MNIKNLRTLSKMTQKEFSEFLNIPLRTIQEWEQERRTPPEYVVELIKYKLGSMALKKAKEINNLQEYLPELEVGETVTINDLWNGEGEVPEISYSYILTHDGEDGDSNYDVWLNYEFEIVEEKENPLESLIKITDINLL